MAEQILDNLRIDPGNDPNPNLNQLTTGALNGTGVFDILINTIKVHLREEYSKGRIVGSDYAQVFLGVISTTISQSIQYMTNLKADELTEAQIGLTRQKILTELAQISDDIPVALEGLGFFTGEIAGIAKVQRDKILTEIALLEQKIDTEIAQTADQIDATDIAGVIGAQIALYKAQTAGFARDAEQKLAKILIDTWSVRATLTEGDANTTNLLNDGSIGEVVAKAKAGIGII